MILNVDNMGHTLINHPQKTVEGPGPSIVSQYFFFLVIVVVPTVIWSAVNLLD